MLSVGPVPAGCGKCIKKYYYLIPLAYDFLIDFVFVRMAHS